MSSTGKLTIAATAVLLLGLCLFLGKRMEFGSQRSASKQHSVAPDLTLAQLDGAPLTLSSYRGKVVLLDFWATWCVPCRQEIPHFVELQERYRDRGLQIIGVSIDDSPDPVRTFAEQFHMNYPIVMGNAKIAEEYGGILGLPIAFLLGRDGRILKKHIGATAPEVFEKELAPLLASQ